MIDDRIIDLDIEESTYLLNENMDKVVFLDKILSYCEDKVLFEKYSDELDKELLNHFNLKKDLVTKLENRFSKEASENLPNNLTYRHLLNALKKV